MLIVEDDRELMFLVEHFIVEHNDVNAIVCETTDDVAGHLDEGFIPDSALIDFSARGQQTSIELCSRLSFDFPECRLYLMSGVTRSLMEEATVDKVEIANIFEKPCSITRMLAQICDDDLENEKKPITLGVTNYPKTTDTQLSTLLFLQEKDPADNSVRQLYAFSLYTAGKFSEAYDIYCELAKRGVSSFLCFYYAGTTCARLRKYSQAIANWNKSLELAPHRGAADKVRLRIERVKTMMSLDDTDYFEKLPEK